MNQLVQDQMSIGMILEICVGNELGKVGAVIVDVAGHPDFAGLGKLHDLLVAVLAEGNVVSRIFAWRPLVAMGIMSYSLYLVHQPLVQALAFVLRHDAGMSPTSTFGGLLLLLPLIVVVAWLLFVLVERYTLTSRPVEVSGLAAAVLFPSLKRRPLHARDEPRNAVSQSEAGIGARSG